MLKVIIVLLLLGVIVSLFSGLVFLFKDSDTQGSKRTLYALGVRISLAVALLGTVSWGIYSGELRMNAPWHNRPPPAEAPTAAAEQPAERR